MSGSFFKLLNKNLTPLPIRKSAPPSKFKKRLVRSVQVILLLVVLSFAWWRIALHLEITGRFSALRKSGLPTSGAELNTWLAPISDEENGALPLSEAFAQRRTFSDGRSNEVNNLLTIERTNIWSPETKALAQDYLALNQPLLEEAHAALKFRQFRFPIDYSYGPNTLLPHLAKLKGAAQIFALRSLLLAEQDGNPAWTKDVESVLALGQTLDTEPIAISFLVRVAMINIAVKVTEKNLSRCQPAPSVAEKLQASFAVVTTSNLLSRAFIGELALTAPAFRLSRAEADALSSDNADNPQTSTPQRFAGKPNPFLWFTGFFERDLNFFLATMTQSIALATNTPPAVLTMNDHFEEAGLKARRRYHVLSAMLLPAYSKFATREASIQANLHLVTTALAIEQYRVSQGRLPTTLAELVPHYLAAVPSDPFDGAPLRYLRPATGYVLYSVGDDRQDDGGRERPKNKNSSDKSSYDLTFIVTR